jgi:soluble lytic murein transglycosylase-like protein
MNTKNFLKVLYLSACIGVIVLLSGMNTDKPTYTSPFEDEGVGLPNSPTSLQMYENIERYSTQYDIPKYVAYNVAYKETTYRGPFDWRYNPSRISCVGALGPMQIMPSTSDWVNKVRHPRQRIMNDVRLNVETSMKLLRKLYNKYHDWVIVCGCYNTGRPMINDYARYCGSNKNYKSKWLSLK